MAARKKKPEEKTRGSRRSNDSMRIDAEELLARSPKKGPGQECRTPEELIHELQVHQIELEMQNESLREAHLALENSWDKYIDLYEFAPVGYLTLTKTAIIEEANLTGAALLGADRHDLVKARFRRFVDPADLLHWDGYFIAVLHNAEKQKCDLVLRKRDGTCFNARLESLRIDQGARDPVVRVAISDITLEKLAEAELIKKSDDIHAANEKLTSIAVQLRKNESRLTTLLQEKEALLSEIHHRVKNNLTAFISLISLDGACEDTEGGRNLKKDLQNRARSMALIHDTLYRTGNFSNVDMDVYLTNLTDQITASYAGSKKVRMIVEARGVVFDLSRATSAGLIVNELITNSFKYAFPASFDCMAVRGEPCTIRVVISPQDGSFVLSVADNGRGLPADFDLLSTKSLGLKLVNFLARHQLRAGIEVRVDTGTEFIFPLNKN